jgi:enoyl-[acyl-carrier protein] reductase I
VLLAGKQLLVTGVLTEQSLATAVVRTARAQGAQVLLTSPVCRGIGVTRKVAARLGLPGDVLELDVTLPDDLAGLESAVRAAGWDRVDGVLHAIAYLPPEPRPTGFSAVPWDVVAPTLQTGAWSLAALVHAVRGLLVRGSSVVGLEFDPRWAWPQQDWLGVAQGALESTARYLARELGPDGVRVNVIACGPQSTLLVRALGDRSELTADWTARAPLGWDCTDRSAVAKAAVALLSDWLPATTGSVLHVDGGAHAVGVAGT